MGFFKKYFGLEEEYDDQYYEEETEKREEERVVAPSKTQKQQKPNIVSLQTVKNGKGPSEMVLLEPRAYSEAQQIADHLLSKRAVVMNLQQVEYDQAKRIVDFLSGTTYAIDGDIKKIGTQTFLCTPNNVDISGQISDLNLEYANTNTNNNNTKGW